MMKAAILGSATADEYLQKFSAVINGQDDYWVVQNNHQGLPKGIQALKKAINAKNCSFNTLIAKAKKGRTPTLMHKPEPCLDALYQMFLNAEQGKFDQVNQPLSALTRIQRQYAELKTKLQTNQVTLEQALKSKDKMMIAAAYKERGLLYLDTDKIRYKREALESFSQALSLEANPSITAFCLRKRASLYLEQGQADAGIHDLAEACQWVDDNPEAWLEYGEALIGLERYEEAIEPLKKALILRPEHYRTQTLLKEAMTEGKLPVDTLQNIKLLCAAGYTLEEMNAHAIERGELPLWLKAAQLGDSPVMSYLASRVDTQIRDGIGNTALHYAARFGHAPLVVLLRHFIEPNTPNKDGETPMYVAAEYGDAETMVALQTIGANVNMPDNDGLTPLYIAAFNGQAPAVAALLEAGADASIQTTMGTALEQARKGNGPGYIEVIRLLEAHLRQYPSGIKPVGATPKAIADTTPKEATNTPDVSAKKPAPPMVLPEASSGHITSANPLLQNLQAQMEGSKQSATVTLTPTPTDITLDTLVHDFQENEKDQQALKDTSQLEAQSQQLQKTLEKEIKTQKSEYALLVEQQIAFQKRMADLKDGLTQSPSIAQQKIQTHLEILQEQLLAVQTQQVILWNEHQRKAHKQEALKRFQSHPNLLLFYRTVQIKLEEIFISFKAVAGGFVNPVDGNMAIASSVFGALGNITALAPIVGPAVTKILKWTFSEIDSARQQNTAINASGLVTLSEVKKYAESIARRLTECYADQLQRLATPEEEQALTPTLKKGINKIKEGVLKAECIPPAKQLAAYGVLWIIDELYDAANIDHTKPLDEALLSAISQKRPAHKIKECWQSITTTLGIAGVRSQSGEIWHPEAVYTLPGIRTSDNEYYTAETLQPQKYGWRLGTTQTVAALKLKQVPAPKGMFVLENQKVIQSISVVNHIKEIKQETEQHSIRLERMEKTGQIVEGARVKALHDELLLERKDKEEMKQRLERLETAFSALATTPTASKRRESKCLIFTDKKDEKEKLQYVLEELRTFFIEEREVGEKTQNYRLYNEYLKKVNNGTQLAYKATQNKHVLYVHGKPLENAGFAAEELSKMITSLANPQPALRTTSPLVT